MSKNFFEAFKQIKTSKEQEWFLTYNTNGDIIEITHSLPTIDYIIIAKEQVVLLKKEDLKHWYVKNKQLTKKTVTSYKKKYTKLVDVQKNETGTVFLDNNPYWPQEQITGQGKKWSYESE